jgi:flagellar secretion chaperone FliS
MSDKPQNQYLRAKIMTASPEQLQTMLYDGAIRFGEQARAAMEAKDIPTAHDRLLRAQNIVLELSTSLKVEVAPELCGKLASLYNYVYRLLIDANMSKSLAKLDEALNLLRYQRETWLMALEALRTLPASAPTAPVADLPPSAPQAVSLASPAAAAPSATIAAAGRILSVEG